MRVFMAEAFQVHSIFKCFPWHKFGANFTADLLYDDMKSFIFDYKWLLM